MDFSKQPGNGFLYRWEENNRGLDHKCGICGTVLSSPRAKKSCFGFHEDVCMGYHKTLFYAGTSHRCEPCGTHREQHYQRHQNIASVVKEILELDGIVKSYHRPLTRRRRQSRTQSESDVLDDDENIEDCVDSDEQRTESSTTELTEHDDPGHYVAPKPETRRERKAARRAARNKARFAGLTKDEIEMVEMVLHPDMKMNNGTRAPTDPLNSSTIKDNLAFKPSTFRYASLRTGVHQKKIMKNVSAKTINQERVQSQNAEILMFMQKLGIVDTNANCGPKNRRVLLGRLREGIRKDLECVANEAQQHMMRMAGYWRYVNKRTYNLMSQKNLLWDWETGAKLEVLDEEIDPIEEGTSNGSDDPPTNGCLSQSEHSDEAVAGFSVKTITQSISRAGSVTGDTSLEAPKCQKSSSVLQNVQTPSPFSGKADARHLKASIPLDTPKEEKKYGPVEAKVLVNQNLGGEKAKASIKENWGVEKAKASIKENLGGEKAKASTKENLGGEKATTKVKEEINGSEEEDDPPSPLQANVGRKKSRGRSQNKSLQDRNNPFAALDGYVEEDWKTDKASQADTSTVSTSRRSSVRAVANPPAPCPSPLRNVAATSSPGPDLSAFPELPSAKQAKPKVEVPHPPAHLTAQQAANFQTQLVRRGGLSASARGGHPGGAGRGERAASLNYATVLRRRLGEN